MSSFVMMEKAAIVDDLFEQAKLLHTTVIWLEGLSSEEMRQALADWEEFSGRKRLEDQAREEALPEFYRSLSPEQGHEIALATIRFFDEGKNTKDYLVEGVLTRLATMVPGALQGLHSQLLKRGIFWGHGEIYRDADPEISTQIIAMLETDDLTKFFSSPFPETSLRQCLLAALAWVGDEQAQAQFRFWAKNPLSWSDSPFFSQPLDDYTRCAGWELSENGKRHELYSRRCYALSPLEKVSPLDLPGPLTVIAPHEDQCIWCGRSIFTLFDLDLHDLRFSFLPLRGKRLRIATCLNCCMYLDEHPFFDVDMYGTSLWSKSNKVFDQPLTSEDFSLPSNQLVLGRRRRTPFETNSSYWEKGLSQIGGHPEWVQDHDYPRCPECLQTMLFVGQLAPIDILDNEEGMIYAFLCTKCKKTTTRFQST